MKNKINVYRILGFLLTIFGFIVLIVFLLSLFLNGYRIVLFKNLDLKITSEIGNFLAGSLGPLWALASVLFFLDALNIQREEVNEFKKVSKDQMLSEMFYKILDLIEINKIEESNIISIISLEFQKFSLIMLASNRKKIFESFDNFIDPGNSNTFEKRMELMLQEISIELFTAVKEDYDLISFNVKHTEKKLELIKATDQLIKALQNITHILTEISVQERQSLVLLLKAKLGNVGCIYLLLLIFFNQISWDYIRYFNYYEILNLYNSVSEINEFKIEYNIFETEFLKTIKGRNKRQSQKKK